MRLYSRKCPTNKTYTSQTCIQRTHTHTIVTTHHKHKPLRVHTSVSHGQNRSVKIKIKCQLFVSEVKRKITAKDTHTKHLTPAPLESTRNTYRLLSGRKTIWQQHEGQKAARCIKQTLWPSRNACQPAAFCTGLK